MESGEKGRGLLQLDGVRIKSRSREALTSRRYFAGICIERGLGSVEEQRVNGAWRKAAWPDIRKLGRLLVRIALGALFVFAGATKAYDPGAFAIEIQRYQLVPWILDALVSVYLPWLEMLAGTLLLLKRFERGALLVITLLLLVFTVALASAMFRG